MKTANKASSVSLLALGLMSSFFTSADTLRSGAYGACVIPEANISGAKLLLDYEACNPKNIAERDNVNFSKVASSNNEDQFQIKHVKTHLCIDLHSSNPSQLTLSESCSTYFTRENASRGGLKVVGKDLVITGTLLPPKHRVDTLSLMPAGRNDLSMRAQIFQFAKIND